MTTLIFHHLTFRGFKNKALFSKRDTNELNTNLRYAEVLKKDQSDCSIGVEYLSLFYPNIPHLLLGMLKGCVAMDSTLVAIAGR